MILPKGVLLRAIHLSVCGDFAGGCPFHVYLEPLENKDPRRSRLKPLLLQRPPNTWLPLMDIDFAAPFRCLSIESVLTVFALMLQVFRCLCVYVSCN